MKKITINGREYLWNVVPYDSFYYKTLFFLEGPIVEEYKFWLLPFGKKVSRQTYITCFEFPCDIQEGFRESALKEIEEDYFKRKKQAEQLKEGTLSI